MNAKDFDAVAQSHGWQGWGERQKIVLLYVLLLAGGLWHVLGWFTELMRMLAGPMMMALALFLSWENANYYGKPENHHKNGLLRWWLFTVAVLVSAFFLEYGGVKSGKIFGIYSYGMVLQPQIQGVPVAISFAWLIMICSSAGIAVQLTKGRDNVSFWLLIALTALLMVVFDWIMEPAAVKLGYWHWQDHHIPLQNYLAWLGFSLIYSLAAVKMGLFSAGMPALNRHAWIAQILYFLLVRLS